MSSSLDRQARRAQKEKAKAQVIIARDFADQIDAATKRLCQAFCRWWHISCQHGLLPLTTTGEDCPHYQTP